jgi:cobalt transporter subunit CbtA
MLKRVVAAAALAGLTAGLLLTAVQHVTVAPLLREAERYESAAPEHADHGEAWSPRDGWQRTLATATANVVLATGFALLLAAGMALRRADGVRSGVLWGIAGYVALFASPAIGMPPELPGSVAAPLRERELWWLAATAGATSGLWLIAFRTSTLHRLLGIALLVAPHLAGAPHAPALPSALPAGLTTQFVVATWAANALLWLVLGALLGHLLREKPLRQVRI